MKKYFSIWVRKGSDKCKYNRRIKFIIMIPENFDKSGEKKCRKETPFSSESGLKNPELLPDA
jgi:hypothetical protein